MTQSPIETLETELAKNMYKAANFYPEHAIKLKELADKFDRAAKECFSSDSNDIKTYLGHWARARKFYAEVTGVPLV